MPFALIVIDLFLSQMALDESNDELFRPFLAADSAAQQSEC